MRNALALSMLAGLSACTGISTSSPVDLGAADDGASNDAAADDLTSDPDDGSQVIEGDGMTGPPRNRVGGTRLAARYFVTSDGTEVFSTWHDTQLDVDCAFELAADGKLRCLPSGATTTTSAVAFKDAACTQPVAYDPGICAATTKYVRAPPTSCPGSVKYYGFGAALAPMTTAYAKTSSGCISFDATGTALYASTELPVTSFVGATRSLGAAAGGLAVVSVLADDGAHGELGLYDTTRGVDCSFVLTVDGTTRCLPGTTAHRTLLYTNATCTIEALSPDVSACTLPGLVSVPELAGCGQAWRAYASSAPSTTRYSGPSASCSPSTGGSNTYFAQGTETATTQFVAATITTTGSGRIRLREAVTSAGVRATVELYDSLRLDACSFLLDGAGALRCLPRTFAKNGYSDAACTQPLGMATGVCASPKYAGTYDYGACLPKTHVFPLGAQFTGTKYQQGGACSPLSAGSYPPGALFYSAGTELAPTEFASATVVDS